MTSDKLELVGEEMEDFKELMNIIAYADDIILIGETLEALKEIFISHLLC